MIFTLFWESQETKSFITNGRRTTIFSKYDSKWNIKKLWVTQRRSQVVNETQGLIALGTFTTIVALIPILMNIFMKAPKKKIKKWVAILWISIRIKSSR